MTEFVSRFPDFTITDALIRALIGIVTVILILAIIDVLIMVVSKIIQAIEGKVSGKKVEATASPTPATAPAAAAPEQVDLVGVDEPTAAVVMAIVSDKSGIPLNRLKFKSIKLMEEKK